MESALEEARQPRPDPSVGIGATPIYVRYPDGIIGLSREALEHLPRDADDRQAQRNRAVPERAARCLLSRG
jgi:hypothetical protein